MSSRGSTDSGHYCLCSDPDYCLRNADPEQREAAIAYRRAHGAPLPRGAKEEPALPSVVDRLATWLSTWNPESGDYDGILWDDDGNPVMMEWRAIAREALKAIEGGA